jgi:predicted nucleic acid-binding protein
MNKVFVDSDVILDLLAQRIPHFHFSALLFTFADMKKLELYTSPTVFCNVFYILRKELGIEKAKSALRKLRLLIKIIDSSEKTIDCALNSDFSDFEEAIQCYTAQNHQISIIVTRNVKDYKTAGIIVQNPETFLCASGLVG